MVIGGNGSQTGAYELSRRGFPVVGVASTVDDDLLGCDITIGADPALNVALEAIDRLKITAASHHRVFAVEVMGRNSGYLALMAADLRRFGSPTVLVDGEDVVGREGEARAVACRAAGAPSVEQIRDGLRPGHLETRGPGPHLTESPMNRRTRALAGILTLSALTFSFAETVFASICAPMLEVAGMDDMVSQMSEMTDAVADASASGGPDCLLVSGHEDSDHGGRDAHCPLSPAVGSGCTAVASLPATQIAAVGWAAGTSRSLGSEDVGVDLLLTHALFRPPRA